MQLVWHGIADRYHVRLGIDGLGLILLFKVSNEASPSFFYGVARAEIFTRPPSGALWGGGPSLATVWTRSSGRRTRRWSIRSTSPEPAVFGLD